MTAVDPTLRATRTTCPYCGVGCGVLATPDGKGGAAISGDPDHPANFGRLCSKGSALGETLALESRLLHPMINDAARIVSDGTASVEAVDALMQGCLGHPTGPLRTGDLIGLDNLADSLNVLLERTGDERYRPCELLLEKVRAGSLGRKTGHGFYDY